MIGPYEFPLKLVWTNGAQSSLKVSVLTGIGPYRGLFAVSVVFGISVVFVKGDPHTNHKFGNNRRRNNHKKFEEVPLYDLSQTLGIFRDSGL